MHILYMNQITPKSKVPLETRTCGDVYISEYPYTGSALSRGALIYDVPDIGICLCMGYDYMGSLYIRVRYVGLPLM